jgi:prephenate dehydrogenase
MFNSVAIIGVGLLGGSLARDLRSKQLAKHIIGVTRSPETAEKALKMGIVDAVRPLEQVAKEVELIVLATPMQAMLPLLEQLSAHVKPETILTDVGSVKTDLYAQIKAHHPDLLSQFILAHPIAGGERSGVTASKDNLFRDKHVILTSTPEQREPALARVRAMWEAVGARVLEMSLQQHDSIFAKTSHLPHVVAFSLVNYLRAQENKEQLFELAAAGFYDFTRIASSDAEMWRDICVTNKPEVVAALDGYVQELIEIRNNINNQNQQSILEYFGAAKHARDTGLLKKQPKN